MASKEYWFDLADYDLVTAEAMLNTKRFLYVGFICHQVIEKALKGYWVLKGNANPPYTHNLLLLAEKSDIANCMNDSQLDLLDFLQPLNIEARYPETKQKLLDILKEDKCTEIYLSTKELLEWIKKRQ